MEERETFEELVGPTLDALFDGARLLTGDPARAEDLVVSVVMDAWRRYGRLDRPADFRGWIVGRLVGRYLDHADGGSAEEARTEAGTASPASSPGPAEPTLETLVMDLAVLERSAPRRLGEIIRRSIRALPMRERLSVWLVDVMDFSYLEAARAMGLASGEFRRILFGARRELQRSVGTDARAVVERGQATRRPGDLAG